MGRKSTFTVVTKKDDPSYVRMFGKEQEALDFTGPEYDKKGYVLTTFEKKTETFFSVVEPEGMAVDTTQAGQDNALTEEA